MTNLVWGTEWMPIEKIKQESLDIFKIKEDLLFVKISSRLQFNQEVIVIRFYPDNFEIIARGSIQGQQDNFWLVVLDPKVSHSLPNKNDKILPIAKINPQNLNEEPLTQPLESKSALNGFREPGYFELGLHKMEGSHQIMTDLEANQYKRFPFQFYKSHFLWYMDFIWRFGVFYSTQNSSIPVIGYDQFDKPTAIDEERFEIRLRLSPWINHFKTHLKFISYKQAFVTSNEDEYILSTQYSGNGIGLYNFYEFSPSLWQGKDRWNLNFHRIYFDYNYIPLNSKDGTVSRGVGAGYLNELELGIQLLLSTNLVPWFNRFFIDLAWFKNSTLLRFSGVTQSPLDGFYVIPPSGQSYEVNQGYYIRFGWRIDDYVSQFFKVR